jgi:hypothetical protein
MGMMSIPSFDMINMKHIQVFVADSQIVDEKMNRTIINNVKSKFNL